LVADPPRRDAVCRLHPQRQNHSRRSQSPEGYQPGRRQAAWKNDLKLDNEVTVGRGYYSESFYYLPTSGQTDLQDRSAIPARSPPDRKQKSSLAISSAIRTSSSPFRRSRSPRFVLLSDRLEKQLEQRLAANPEDIDALSIKAQVLLQAGSADESLALLRKAAALAPDRTTVRDLLVKVMMVLMRKDFAAHIALTTSSTSW